MVDFDNRKFDPKRWNFVTNIEFKREVVVGPKNIYKIAMNYEKNGQDPTENNYVSYQ